MTVDQHQRPVLLSLDGHGFYVLRYTAVPEPDKARINFELVDPETAGGASVEVLVDPKLIQELNKFNSSSVTGRVFLVWVDSTKGEVAWQVRKASENETG